MLECRLPIPDRRSPNPNLGFQTQKRPTTEPKSRPRSHGARPSRGATVKQSEPDAKPRAIQDLASAGWVSVPNSGKNLFDDATQCRCPARMTPVRESVPNPPRTRDVRGHAAKDVSFELESPRARVNAELEQNGRQSSSVQAWAMTHIEVGRRPSRAQCTRRRAPGKLLDDLSALLQFGPVLSGLVEGECRQVSGNRQVKCQ